MWACESGLTLVIRVDQNLVISRIPVKETKEGMVHEAFYHFVNEWQWEVILLSGLVKFPVVNAHPPPSDSSLRNEFILFIPYNHHPSLLWHNLDRANPLTVTTQKIHTPKITTTNFFLKNPM